MGTEIYTVGGTVQANAQGLYIPRQADPDLLQLCRDSTFAYVLTPRQMGKSSLMMRTAETLYGEGIAAVIIDLTKIGTQLTADQWYVGLLTEIADQLMLSVNVNRWWQARQHLGGTQRLSHFFEQVVISETTDPVVIFIDEIDTTLTLGFADDFYAAIRGLYVARAKQPALHRLSFVLIGVATPSDLIKDAKRTPFNVGERVELTDFTQVEVLPMAIGLGLVNQQAEQVLEWMLKWTGGHPYLTQRLCKALVDEGKQNWQENDVDEMVHRTFLGEESEKDNNLQFVRDMLTKRAPEDVGEEVLKTYREVWCDKTIVKDEEQSLVKSHLKLAGVVKKEGEVLQNRNLIYQTVFDKKWVQKHLPESLWQRLKPAMPLIAGLSVFSVGVSVAALYAVDQGKIADSARAIAELAKQEALDKAKSEEAANEKLQEALKRAKKSETEALRQKKQAIKSAREVNAARKEEIKQREKALVSQKLAKRRQTEAETQKNIADQQRIAAEQATAREKEQTIIAQQASQRVEKEAKLATLRGQAASGLYWLSAANPAFGFALAIDTMNQSLSANEVEVVAQSVLLKSIQRVQEINLLQGHQDSVNSVSFSPDGTRIVSGSSDNTVRIWDAKTGRPIGEPLKGHWSAVFSVSFSPDGTRIVSGGWDYTVRIWDAKTGQPMGEPLKGHQNVVNSVSFSPDGTRIVSGSRDNTLRIWNAKTGQPMGEPLKGHQNVVYSVSFSSDGRRIVSGSRDKTVRIWDAKTGQPMGEPLQGHQDSVESVSFSSDGRRIVSGSSDKTVRIWDAKTGQPMGEPFKGHQNYVYSVSFSPDGTRIVSGSRDKTVRIWDAKTGQPMGEPLQGHQDSVDSVSFSPDGTRIVSGSRDKTVRIWDAKTGQPMGEPLQGHQDSVDSVSFSPDGTHIVSGSWDSTVRIWDAKTGQLIGEPLQGHQSEVYSVSFSPDGTRIVSGSLDSTVRIWDAKTGQLIGEPLQGHQFSVLSVSFSPDGTRIISGSWDSTVRIWDAKTGQLIGEPLQGHQSEVYSVSFSPDGTRIISGSWDSTVRIWDAKTGQPIGEPLQGHQNAATSVSFSPDGTRIVSGSWDNTVRIWKIGPESLTRLACNRFRHHPLLHQPEKVTSDQSIVKAAQRSQQICQQYDSSWGASQAVQFKQWLKSRIQWFFRS
ncbi:AAA-like domain-containing protein [Acaryochloris marina]|uniref:AAA-like domain-containing protein n=1 Tax=Acaryochloris marina TaxID=155978 RepID=UPI0021C270B5|nr:AAA-like domain-containing protein [Acaryochloris marina]BDM78830.1 hypothetical protein AM10699_16990 [Acaryochloris marina MBIC10699]